MFAGVAAGFAVHEAVLANANFEHGLAKAAVLLALALALGHFALCAAVFAWAGSGGHINNVTPDSGVGNVPLVTRCQRLPIEHLAESKTHLRG